MRLWHARSCVYKHAGCWSSIGRAGTVSCPRTSPPHRRWPVEGCAHSTQACSRWCCLLLLLLHHLALMPSRTLPQATAPSWLRQLRRECWCRPGRGGRRSSTESTCSAPRCPRGVPREPLATRVDAAAGGRCAPLPLPCQWRHAAVAGAWSDALSLTRRCDRRGAACGSWVRWLSRQPASLHGAAAPSSAASLAGPRLLLPTGAGSVRARHILCPPLF